MRPSTRLSALILSLLAAPFALSGCSKSQPGPEAMPPADTAQADAAAQAAEAKAAEDAKAAELAAKEQELAQREAELKVKELEAELARRDAETAAAAAAAAKAAPARKTPAKASTQPAPKATAPAAPIVVAAGTQLAVELTTPLSTKTNLVGDAVEGRLASDLVVDGRRAAKAGATVRGSVTKVVSGSKKVGGVPVLALTFDTLVANGTTVTVNAPYSQQGKSETGKDTAKIVGGAAAGAIIGHQIDSDKGSVIGGILGGAAGTAAAHKTGGEVTIPAGQVLTVATGSSFESKP